MRGPANEEPVRDYIQPTPQLRFKNCSDLRTSLKEKISLILALAYPVYMEKIVPLRFNRVSLSSFAETVCQVKHNAYGFYLNIDLINHKHTGQLISGCEYVHFLETNYDKPEVIHCKTQIQKK